ncbi:MAG: polyprenol monophosphomannose synthase [Chloroflexi bacterium]|nr:polyprenol monophosphomannose synthase [Chloroflexota bacterium]
MRQPVPEAARYVDTWVVLPTYNEADNLRGISAAILEKLPGATLLVVDDNSPDGTGRIADELAAANDQVRVLHRPRKQGLGRAYIQGFGVALGSTARRIVQMDADWSHHPDHLPSLMAALEGGPGTPRSDGADIVIGSRYVRGGGVREWGLGRRLLSRAGSTFGRLVLRLGPHDLTGAYKVWRREMLARMPWHAVHSGGYVFNIECSYLADRLGARIVEVPIIFVDRRAGQSKMSRRIVFEALMVVLTLRWQELRGRRPEAMPDELPAQPAAAEGDGTSPA